MVIVMMNIGVFELASLITSYANIVLLVAHERVNDVIYEIQLYAYLSIAGIIIGLFSSATALITASYKMISR
jgi:hypothetical protein